MAVAFILVFLVLHTAWQIVGAQEMFHCLSNCGVGRNIQEKMELQYPREPCIDKPPGKRASLSPLQTWSSLICWVFRLQETVISSFLFPSLK